ncbi:hypothetical protein EIMP300_23240 [Escherichia coli]|uniref:Uncharacterized protein n=1 Tax=Escherichia coli TaxID=562 RepID=A0A8S0FKV7_ECOLX|nr:hypothetical protein EIMP300_23240 [Escherichia coli]
MKSPTFYGKTVEVGPLANMLVKLAAGRESTQNKLNEIVAIYQKLTGNTLEVAQLHSTLGRIIGRTVHCCELQDILQNQYSALIQQPHHQYRQRRSHHLCEAEHSGNG